MDGVIVDTEPLHREAYFRMFEEVGMHVSPSLYDSFTGQATLPICRTLIETFDLNNSPEDLMARKRRHFKDLFDSDDRLSLLDGVYELIVEYCHNGLSLVLASSASMTNINRIFKRFDLDQFFKAKISGADLKASKPHPEIFIRAAALSGENRGSCMVIEDSTNGIIAAKEAGIYCVAFKGPNAINQDYSRADMVISSYDQIRYPKIQVL